MSFFFIVQVSGHRPAVGSFSLWILLSELALTFAFLPHTFCFLPLLSLAELDPWGVIWPGCLHLRNHLHSITGGGECLSINVSIVWRFI